MPEDLALSAEQLHVGKFLLFDAIKKVMILAARLRNH
jgi:hypothetical protein